MERNSATLSAVALLCALLPACAGDSARYPSLAIRDVERFQGQYQPASMVEPAELPIRSLAPDASVDALIAQATASHDTFAQRAAAARGLAARAAGTGRDSELRGNAIVALADLTALRSQTEVPLGDLDLLIAERTNRLEPADDAIAAQAQVLALVNEQDRTLNELWRLLDR